MDFLFMYSILIVVDRPDNATCPLMTVLRMET